MRARKQTERTPTDGYRARFQLHGYYFTPSSCSKFLNAGHKTKVIDNVCEEAYCV